MKNTRILKNISRALSILLMLALAIGLVACVGSDTPADTTQNTEETAGPTEELTTEEVTTEEVTTEEVTTEEVTTEEVTTEEATTAPNPPADEPKDAYDAAKDGDLLYAVNFKGDDVYAPKMTYTYQTWGEDVIKTVSEDGKKLSVKGFSFVSGKLNGFPLDDKHVYTITYAVEFSNQYNVFQGLYIDLNENYTYGTTSGAVGYNGFRSVYNSYAFAQNGTNYTLDGKNYLTFATSPAAGICPYTTEGTPQMYNNQSYPTVRHQYKLVVNGPENTIEYYVLAQSATAGADPVWAQLYSIKLDTVGSSFKSDTLHLAFQSYYSYNSLSVVYSDVNVYKGKV